MVVQRCAAWPDEALQVVGEHVQENHASARKSAPHALQPDLHIQHVVVTRSAIARWKPLSELSRMGRERVDGWAARRRRTAEELDCCERPPTCERAVHR